MAELDKLQSECSLPNWDGHDAKPVDPESLNHVRRFVSLFPSGIAEPDFGCDPDGEVLMEFGAPPGVVLSISVSPDGVLSWVLWEDGVTDNGRTAFTDCIPDEIMNIIRQVTNG